MSRSWLSRFGVSFVVVVAAVAASAPGARTQTTGTYQSDHVIYTPRTGITSLSIEMKVARDPCSDPDSCSNGNRKSSGYTWLAALAAEMASPSGACVGGLHGGIAMGGGARKSAWYLDWGGYSNNCTDSSGGLPGRGWDIELQENHWYRIRMFRSSWDGTTGCYVLSATDVDTGVTRSAAAHCLRGAATMRNPYHFTEVIESGGPCTTDFRSLETRNPLYADATTSVARLTTGTVSYESTCGNTFMRTNGPNGATLDTRESPRGNFDGSALSATGYAVNGNQSRFDLGYGCSPATVAGFTYGWRTGDRWMFTQGARVDVAPVSPCYPKARLGCTTETWVWHPNGSMVWHLVPSARTVPGTLRLEGSSVRISSSSTLNVAVFARCYDLWTAGNPQVGPTIATTYQISA